MMTKQCSNCRQEKHYAKGRCRKCYEYHWNHGVERPRHLFSPDAVQFCARCKDKPAVARGLCMACYRYQTRHGKPRPKKYLTNSCMNCGNPQIRCTGLCATCYTYKQRTGRMRPRHLIEGIKFCECGNHATHTLHTAHGDIDVCEACYQLEHSYSGGDGSAQVGTFDARRMDYHT